MNASLQAQGRMKASRQATRRVGPADISEAQITSSVPVTTALVKRPSDQRVTRTSSSKHIVASAQVLDRPALLQVPAPPARRISDVRGVPRDMEALAASLAQSLEDSLNQVLETEKV